MHKLFKMPNDNALRKFYFRHFGDNKLPYDVSINKPISRKATGYFNLPLHIRLESTANCHQSAVYRRVEKLVLVNIEDTKSSKKSFEMSTCARVSSSYLSTATYYLF